MEHSPPAGVFNPAPFLCHEINERLPFVLTTLLIAAITIFRNTCIKEYPMWTRPESDQFADELYLAGERVPRGTYKQLGSNRRFVMEQNGVLPASMDGRVACYVRLDHSWDPFHLG